MKKLYSLCLMFCLLFLLSSCVPFENLPEGVWQSEGQNIMIYILPKYVIGEIGRFLGVYTSSDEEIKIIVSTDNASRFTISRATALASFGEYGDERIFLNSRLDFVVFRGSFRIISEDELHFIPVQEETSIGMVEYELIIFHRVEEYEPINVRNWGQHLNDIELWFPSE